MKLVMFIIEKYESNISLVLYFSLLDNVHDYVVSYIPIKQGKH